MKKSKILISHSEMSSVIISFVCSAITSIYDIEQTHFASQDNSPLQLLALSAPTSHAAHYKLPVSLVALKMHFLCMRFLCLITVFLNQYGTFFQTKMGALKAMNTSTDTLLFVQNGAVPLQKY